MTIPPFIAGVVTTLVAELVIINIIAIISVFTNSRKTHKNKSE